MDNKSVADEISEKMKIIIQAKEDRKKLKAIIRKQEALIYQLKKKNNLFPPPSPYSIFMKQKMIELKDSHLNMTIIERIKMIADAWAEKNRAESSL